VKKTVVIVASLLLCLALAVGLLVAQETTPSPRAEITGVDPSAMPTVVTSINVFDSLGQPVGGLTAADFVVVGELADRAEVISVENISSDNLPFSTVLAIDVSSSMFDFPIARAKEAARVFVDTIRPIDSVAILTFGRNVELVQDFTTDKNALNAAIDSIQALGQTPLYQGAFDAVELAARAPNQRRAVIVLSDGAEFGGISRVGRQAAVELAVVRGVPVYTIGIGFGFDRTYLQELSTATNAQFDESPDATELSDIFGSLARLLSSQYIVTLNVDVPLDGTTYPLALRVTTPEGAVETPAGSLRAPIPVPLVSFPDAPTAALLEPTTFTAEIRADDPITGVIFGITNSEGGGVAAAEVAEAPYTFTLDPAAFQPGAYTLTAIATDADGDLNGAELPFAVGALPSEIAFAVEPETSGVIREPVTFTLTITGQTEPVSVGYGLRGQPLQPLEAPYSFTLDPLEIAPGETELMVEVVNAGGVTTTVTVPLTIAALAPIISVEGLSEGQEIAEPTNVTLDVVSQTPITAAQVAVGETPLEIVSAGTYRIDPRVLRPGAATFSARLTNAGGETTTVSIPFTVAALPPVIRVEGIAPGDTLTADTAVTIRFESQTRVIHVAVFVDDEDIAHLVQEPFIFGIGVLDYPPGSRTLRIIADNAGGRSATLEIPFTISPAPAMTATAAAVQATVTREAQITATAVAIQATATQAAVIAQQTQAQATAFQQRTEVQATAFQQGTQAAVQQAQATQVAQQTQAQATAFQQRTQAAVQQAQATQVAQVTQAQATVFQQRTEVQATAFQQETQAAIQQTQAQATQVAQQTQAQATAFQQRTEVQATAFQQETQAAIQQTQAQVTQVAQVAAQEATTLAQQTNAAASATARAEQVRATAVAQQATVASQQTATANVVNATARAAAFQATATANQATLDAQRAQATADAQTATSFAATRTQSAADVRATATQAQAAIIAQRTIAQSARIEEQQAAAQAVQTADAGTQVAAVQTETAQFTPSDTPTPSLTVTPSLTPTASPDSALTATSDAATQAVEDARRTRQAQLAGTVAAETRQALETISAQNQAAARATQDIRQTRAAATTTADARAQLAQTVNAALTQTASALPTATPTPTDTASNTPTATLTATETPDLEATLAAERAGTSVAQTATMETRRTEEALIPTLNARATADARATAEEIREATVFARATTNAQATLDVAAAALGTITIEPTTAEPEALTAIAQAAETATPLPSVPPTLTPVGTLTLIEVGTTPGASDFAPIAVVVVVVLLLLLLVFLLARRRISGR
jgi:hypothetical protein